MDSNENSTSDWQQCFGWSAFHTKKQNQNLTYSEKHWIFLAGTFLPVKIFPLCSWMSPDAAAQSAAGEGGSADKQIQIWRQDIRAQVQTNTLNDVLKTWNKKWWRQGDNPWWLIGWKKWKWLMLMARWSSPLSDPCPGHCLCFCIHLRLFFRVRAWQKFYKAFGDSEKNFSLDAYIVEGFEVWPIIKEGGGLGKTGTERM